MRAILIAILLFTISLLGADFTNGVFCVDKPVEYQLITQGGIASTNQMSAGESRMVSTAIIELHPLLQTTFYFSGGLIVLAETNSILSISVFDQEVKNLGDIPRPAVFGSHNISLELNRGTFVVLYPIQDTNSSFSISSPLAMYQMETGKFLFHISDNRSLVYVLDGMLRVRGDRSRIDIAKKGNKAITGHLDTDIVSTIRTISSVERDSIIALQNKADALTNAVQFFVIDGRVRGVLVQ